MGLLLFLIAFGTFAALLFRFRRSNSIFGLALAIWIAAIVWNWWILDTCSGDCNIRVDLVPIAPLVLLATSFALAQAFRWWRGSK